MTVCLTSFGPTLNSRMQPAFARCEYFIFVDVLSQKMETVANPNAMAASDAGEKSARLVIERGATAVITGRVGSKAEAVLKQAGVSILTPQGDTVSEAVEAFKKRASF